MAYRGTANHGTTLLFAAVSGHPTSVPGSSPKLALGAVQGLKFPENNLAHTCLLNTHPDARASVKISSSDPFASPCVFTNLLGHESDVSRLAACITKEREVAKVMNDEFGYKLSEFSILGRDVNADLSGQVCARMLLVAFLYGTLCMPPVASPHCVVYSQSTEAQQSKSC